MFLAASCHLPFEARFTSCWVLQHWFQKGFFFLLYTCIYVCIYMGYSKRLFAIAETLQELPRGHHRLLKEMHEASQGSSPALLNTSWLWRASLSCHLCHSGGPSAAREACRALPSPKQRPDGSIPSVPQNRYVISEWAPHSWRQVKLSCRLQGKEGTPGPE